MNTNGTGESGGMRDGETTHYWRQQIPEGILGDPQMLSRYMIQIIINSEEHRVESNHPGVPHRKRIEVIVFTDCADWPEAVAE